MGLNYQAAVNITANFTGDAAFSQAKASLNSLNKSAQASGTVFGSLKAQVEGLNKPFDQIKASLKGVAGLVLAKEIVEYTKSLLDYGDQLQNLKEKTGIGVEALTGLKGVAEANNIEFQGLEKSLTRFSANVARAGAGNDSAIQGFRALGVSLRNVDGSLKPSGDLLLQISDKFQHLKDGPTKAAIAMSLFGKSGADLIPILNAGREEIEKYQLSFSDQFTERAAEFSNVFTQLKVSTQQVSVDIVSQFLPALNEVLEVFEKLGAGGLGGDMKDFFKGLGEVIRQVGVSSVVAFEAIAITFQGLKTFVEGNINSIKVLAQEFFDLGDLADAFWYKLTGQSDKASASLKSYLDHASGDLKSFYDNEKKLGGDFAKDFESRVKSTLKNVSDLEKHSIFFGDGQNSKPKSGKSGTGSATFEDTTYQAEIAKVNQLKDELKALSAQYDLESQKVDISTEEYQKRKIAIDESLKSQKAIENFKSPQAKAQYTALTDEIVKQKQALIDLKNRQDNSFGDGAKAAFQKYVEAAQKTGLQFKSAFTAALKGVEDSIVAFIKTGKLSFQDLANTIQDMLLHIAVQKALAIGLTNVGLAAATGAPAVTPNANGGIMTSSGPVPLRKYASGGIATSPQLALFGEGSKPEAYVPLPDGRRIPVDMRNGSNQGNSTNIQVNVSIASDGSTSDSQSDTQKGKQFGQLLSAAVKTVIVNEKRPGGLLA